MEALPSFVAVPTTDHHSQLSLHEHQRCNSGTRRQFLGFLGLIWFWLVWCGDVFVLLKTIKRLKLNMG